MTRKAVVAYQTSVGLPATGYVGLMTRAKINDDLSKENAPAASAEITETGATTPNTNSARTNVNTSSAVAGCTSTSVYSATTGLFCNSAPTAVAINTTSTQGWDVCRNIEGTQTVIPANMYADGNGNCFNAIINNTQLSSSSGAQNTTTVASGGIIVTTRDDLYGHGLNNYGGRIGVFSLKSYVEDIKIKSITILPNISNMSSTTVGLSNVSLRYNGSQIGSSQNWTSGALTFLLGNALVVATSTNSENLLEVVADLVGANGGPAYSFGNLSVVSVALLSSSSNGIGQSSGNTYDVPSATTLQSQGFSIPLYGGVRISKSNNFSDSVIASGATNTKIGSFNIASVYQSANASFITFKIATGSSSVFSNISFRFGSSGNILTNNGGDTYPTFTAIPIPLGSAGTDVNIYADVAPGATFGPAPAISILSATINVGGIIPPASTTLPVDGQSVSVI